MFAARFPLEIETKIAQYAAHFGTSKSAIVREALQDFFKQNSAEQIEVKQAKTVARYPNEPCIDWSEARDVGRL